MYVPAPFSAADAEAMIADFAARRLAILICIDSDGALRATHLPMIWNPRTRTLEGHIARANPHARPAPGARGLAILPGPEAYVSPGWYPSKAEHGRVVPTWNYEAVHLAGPLEWHEDAAWLEANVRALSDRHEAGFASPWSVDDAPAEYIGALLRGIVGVTLKVDRIDAKSKLSQNKSTADREGVAARLATSDDAQARDIAALMREI